jgi:hypothetical protein
LHDERLFDRVLAEGSLVFGEDRLKCGRSVD